METGLFWIFFIYGLAFFGMGVAMAMESWKASALAEARVLLPLAGFGLIHGAHEWLEAYLMQAQQLGVTTPAWFSWLRLGMLLVSFSSLLIFAVRSLSLIPRPVPLGIKRSAWIVVFYILVILASALLTLDRNSFQIENLIDALARYLLAVPSSALAGLAFYYIGINNPNTNTTLARLMDGTAIGFGIYAATQLFVPPIAMFPASLLNNAAFLAFAGFPIQVVRTATALLVTVCLLRSTQVTEDRLKAELQASQETRLEALAQRESLRRELLRHTVRAQEDERSRIARELHDETAQTLTAFSLELATLRNSLPRRSASVETVDRLLDLSRQVSQSLYRIMTGLRPAQLDELGASKAIRSLVARDFESKGFSFPVEILGTPRRLDQVVETVLFRVAQEALNNVARHSGVQSGRVEIRFEADQVTLRVSDGGHGFDPAESFHAPRGWGLEGMKDRIESVGGTLQITSQPDQGTLIEARIPVESKEMV